ncbi:hypothetical protein ANN_27271 [Periplaneta americana]|uniref:Uncharacterized protein n=1 Tax=Periplaneta americana TaxID=6978 RepID=A0ABQ8RXT4_PERAM|nr:hypothetical protein ANN_27271 [Periplaneta americana]
MGDLYEGGNEPLGSLKAILGGKGNKMASGPSNRLHSVNGIKMLVSSIVFCARCFSLYPVLQILDRVWSGLKHSRFEGDRMVCCFSCSHNCWCDVSANSREKAESHALAGLKVIEISPATSKLGKYCDVKKDFKIPNQCRSSAPPSYTVPERRSAPPPLHP